MLLYSNQQTKNVAHVIRTLQKKSKKQNQTYIFLLREFSQPKSRLQN